MAGYTRYRFIRGADLAAAIQRGLDEQVARNVDDTVAALTDLGQQTTAEMKAERPWQDESGNARDSLWAGVRSVRRDGGKYGVTFSLGYGAAPDYDGAQAPVPFADGERDDPRMYGPILEATGYAVVGPTTDRVTPEIRAVRDRVWKRGL